MTPQEIAQVVAGLFFEDISILLKLPGVGVVGTEPTRRPVVHQWTTDTVVFLESEYQRIFTRGLDLEGAGSWVLHAIRGKSRSWITTELEKSYARGDR